MRDDSIAVKTRHNCQNYQYKVGRPVPGWIIQRYDLDKGAPTSSTGDFAIWFDMIFSASSASRTAASPSCRPSSPPTAGLHYGLRRSNPPEPTFAKWKRQLSLPR